MEPVESVDLVELTHLVGLVQPGDLVDLVEPVEIVEQVLKHCWVCHARLCLDEGSVAQFVDSDRPRKQLGLSLGS